MLPWVIRGYFHGVSGWIWLFSPYFQTRYGAYTLSSNECFHFHFWWQFRVIHFSGVEMWEGERREYIMNVRAHMSCRRWFQYHVTVLRVFHATVPISSSLSCFKWKKLWLQFGRLGSIVRLGCYYFSFIFVDGEEANCRKSRENFAESFFPDFDFHWTLFPVAIDPLRMNVACIS